VADVLGTAGRAAISVADAPAEAQGAPSCLLHGAGPAAGMASHVCTRLAVALVSRVHVGPHTRWLLPCCPKQ